jgi:hypothetical protein
MAAESYPAFHPPFQREKNGVAAEAGPLQFPDNAAIECRRPAYDGNGILRAEMYPFEKGREEAGIADEPGWRLVRSEVNSQKELHVRAGAQLHHLFLEEYGRRFSGPVHEGDIPEFFPMEEKVKEKGAERSDTESSGEEENVFILPVPHRETVAVRAADPEAGAGFLGMKKGSDMSATPDAQLKGAIVRRGRCEGNGDFPAGRYGELDKLSGCKGKLASCFSAIQPYGKE